MLAIGNSSQSPLTIVMSKVDQNRRYSRATISMSICIAPELMA